MAIERLPGPSPVQGKYAVQDPPPENLHEELKRLEEEQQKAMNTAAYFRMTVEEARQSDIRRNRIMELRKSLTLQNP